MKLSPVDSVHLRFNGMETDANLDGVALQEAIALAVSMQNVGSELARDSEVNIARKRASYAVTCLHQHCE